MMVTLRGELPEKVVSPRTVRGHAIRVGPDHKFANENGLTRLMGYTGV